MHDRIATVRENDVYGRTRSYVRQGRQGRQGVMRKNKHHLHGCKQVVGVKQDWEQTLKEYSGIVKHTRRVQKLNEINSLTGGVGGGTAEPNCCQNSEATEVQAACQEMAPLCTTWGNEDLWQKWDTQHKDNVL